MPTILDLDLGKFKGVACCYDPGTAEARYTDSHQRRRA